MKRINNFESMEIILNFKVEERQALVRYWPSFLTQLESKELYDEIYNLKNEYFSADVYKIFNKDIVAPRLTAAFGEKGIVYGYAGMSRETIDLWPKLLLQCKQKIQDQLGVTLNYAFINIYEVKDLSGNKCDHYIGWHADKEKDIIQDSDGGTTICSVSLGDPRKFQLRKTYKKGEPPTRIYSQVLENGSLCTMEKHTQILCKHQVPKKRKATTPRINITFRNMKKKI